LGEALLGELPVEFWSVAAPLAFEPLPDWPVVVLAAPLGVCVVVVVLVVLCVLPTLDPVCEVPDDVAEEGLLV
jgi:hypothetical protein